MSVNPRKMTLFDERSEKYGTTFRRVAVAICRECGAEEKITLKMGASLLPPDAVAKKLSTRGWSIGPNTTWHLCPECASSKTHRAALSIVPQKQEQVSMTSEPAMKAELPRTMERDDRRIIYAKLNDVYVDEKRGYDSGWSDHKVATDLGVPRGWVEQVREEMFGPTGSNPDIEEFMRLQTEVKELQAEVATLSALKGQMINIDNAFKKVDLARLMDRLNKLDKLAVEVRKHFPG